MQLNTDLQEKVSEDVDVRAHHMDLIPKYSAELEKYGYILTAEGVLKEDKLVSISDPNLHSAISEIYTKELEFRRKVAETSTIKMNNWFDNIKNNPDSFPTDSSLLKYKVYEYLRSTTPGDLPLDWELLPTVFIPSGRVYTVNKDFPNDAISILDSYIISNLDKLRNEVLSSYQFEPGYFQDAYQLLNPENSEEINALNEKAKEVAINSILIFLAAPSAVKAVVGFGKDGICEAACIIGGKHCGNIKLRDSLGKGQRDIHDMQALEKFLEENNCNFEIVGDKDNLYQIITELGNVRRFARQSI